MDYHYFKERLNHFYDRYIDADARPTFFDIQQTLPVLNTITAQFQIIKQEYEQARTHILDLPQYHDVDPGEMPISQACEKKWNVMMLHLLGYEMTEFHNLCPVTFQLLHSIPGLIQAFFSILEPGKSIPLHEGPYRGYLRYHLGIQVPKTDPPSIVVNNQPYTWREGEAVLFDDSWPHEVRNQSHEPRTVLIIDMLRPMPLLPQLINRFTTNVIARYFYGRPVVRRAQQYGTQIAPLLD
jgi:aspartate beta-hydroxylase